MKLQTKIPLSPQENQIDYHSKIAMLGSCFVENMGGKMDYFKFHNLQNPFGIIFHPIAVEKLVDRAVNKISFTNDDLFYFNEQWQCFEVHSSISTLEKEELLVILNNKLKEFRDYLLSASHIVLTFGTAWIYQYRDTNTIVANCHKIPQNKFVKEILSIGEITNSLEKISSFIKGISPNVNIIMTVSPVRHLKDGFIENTLSKAHLLSGLHNVIDSEDNIHYFPSYEIMMDELRDYRFYKEDMIHPNKTAISIIWDAFSKVWISNKTEEIQKEIAVIQTGLLHQSFKPKSHAHHKFLIDLESKIKKLQRRFPAIKFLE